MSQKADYQIFLLVPAFLSLPIGSPSGNGNNSSLPQLCISFLESTLINIR